MDEPLFSEEFLQKIERLGLIARREEGSGALRADRHGKAQQTDLPSPREPS